MKKIILSIVIGIIIIYSPIVKAEDNLPSITNHQVVKVYLFWTSWCPHCHDFIKYFSDKYEKYSDYFEIVTYQLDSPISEETRINKNLKTAVCEELNTNSDGVPLIIIGNWYQRGFGTDGSNIIEKALLEYQNNDYTDVVKRISNEVYGHGISRSFKNAMDNVNNKSSEEEGETKNNITSIIDIIYNLIMNFFIKFFG